MGRPQLPPRHSALCRPRGAGRAVSGRTAARHQHEDGESRCAVTLDERFGGHPASPMAGSSRASTTRCVVTRWCGPDIARSQSSSRSTAVHTAASADSVRARIERTAASVLYLAGSCHHQGRIISTCRATFKEIDRSMADALFAPVDGAAPPHDGPRE